MPIIGWSLSLKGIYITQSTGENGSKLQNLIHQSKKVGINTFIIDLNNPSITLYHNVQKVRENNIRYIARIVVFPGGATKDQIFSIRYLRKIDDLIKTAKRYGAQEIQLDYIRYRSSQSRSPQNAKDIYQVIKWFKEHGSIGDTPLQIDIFGEVSFGESPYIGQNIKLFADLIDAACPMLYPSHFEPYLYHATRPYETVSKALNALKGQFKQSIPFKLYPFIEIYNYRYPLSREAKHAYIRAQIRAAEDAKADGWFVWNAQNNYDNLFEVLRKHILEPL